MPGPTSHGGWRRHINMARNAADEAYGSVPDAEEWHAIPILDNGFTLKATSPLYRPNLNIGKDWREHVAIPHSQVVQGDVTTLLFPEIAQYLLDAALLRVDDVDSPNHQDVYGHVIDYFTPVDPRRYLGVVVNTLRLACTHTGDADAQVTLSCLGLREEEADALVETDFDYTGLSYVPFMADFATVAVNGVDVLDVENWTLTVENNIGEAP